MFSYQLLFALALVCALGSSVSGINHGQAALDWQEYKLNFSKSYENTDVTEPFAQYYFNYNRNLIASHNNWEALGRRTFRLRINQFTDMRLIHFNALLPVAVQPSTSFNVTPMAVQDPPASYDPREALGLASVVQDQGTVCSSSWAYATAKAIELMQALQLGNMAPEPLSAQNLLDCAGSGTGCTTQAAQTAFDFLTQFQQDLHTEADYANNNTNKAQGMCVPLTDPVAVVTQLGSYARIANGDDAALMRYVAAGYPVVIEFNPTSFEFMHYGSGVFQQPAKTQSGSHFMVVIGYGTDANSGLNYWLLENSFGESWGEDGYIRILRSATAPIARNAIFPYELR